jgi:hypothetical protein
MSKNRPIIPINISRLSTFEMQHLFRGESLSWNRLEFVFLLVSGNDPRIKTIIEKKIKKDPLREGPGSKLIGPTK